MTEVRTQEVIGNKRIASAILEECVLDIQEGRWVCNVLARDSVSKHKPLGCAVGLIAINGFAVAKADLSSTIKRYEIGYPSETMWSDEPLKALSFLAQAIPVDKRTVGSDADLVITFNDHGGRGGGKLTNAEALYWFSTAALIAHSQERA